MKLVSRKNGLGYVTSYTITVGRAEARDLGWTNEAGEIIVPELVKSIDNETKTLTVRPAE
ncbi:MAG: hypothetical protein ACOYJA_09625 [Christensenellales bacterium]|jgi:hypothetical protein